MKKTAIIPILLFLFHLTVNSQQFSHETLSLKGNWRFELDQKNAGKSEGWFNRLLNDRISLPGTTDDNGKGTKVTDVKLNQLTQKYNYIGAAWYQKDVEIPANWKGKTIELFLERTKATEVWVDGIYFPLQKNLQTPHIYTLTDALTVGKHTITIRIDNSWHLFPVGGSHALSEDTQTNWNGIIGRIELIAKDQISIISTKITPDIDKKKADLHFIISNPKGEKLIGEISCEAKGFNGNNHNVTPQKFQFNSSEKEIIVECEYKMGDKVALWNEFTPNLYCMSISLKAKGKNKYVDRTEESFGMMKFATKGTQFLVNNKVVFLRGKHDACVFPLTGYPPMTKDEWIRQMRISKEYGINHYRFHSWTPPKAAFEAADIVGIYLQPELPNRQSFTEKDSLHYSFHQIEGVKILETYGNHPSFVMFSLGNELGGDQKMMSQIIKYFRPFSNHCLFTQGSNNFFWNPKVLENEDYFVGVWAKKRKSGFEPDLRASFSFADDPAAGGIINGQFPNTERTFESAVNMFSIPAIGHETGQYQTMPNFNEIDKYTGVLEAKNFEAFKKQMIDKKMYGYWQELFMASGKLAALCYKDDNEISMRTPKFGGFQMLDLQDFPGQGSALVGVLDAFMDSKGVVTPTSWRESCSAQTIQAKMSKFVWLNNETFTAEAIVINYGDKDLPNDKISWTLSTPDGVVLKSGSTTETTYKQGEINSAGAIKANFSDLKNAQRLILKMTTASAITNQYNIWVYPPIEKINKPSDIIVCDLVDAKIIKQLDEGAKVLLFPDSASISNSSVGGLFISDYWCYPMFKSISEGGKKPVSPGTLGLLIDKQHPVFKGFPTTEYTDWQWWSVIKKSRPIVLDSTDVTYRPIVQVVDNFERCSKLGLMFEFQVGKGKLFVCSADLKDKNDIVAQTLLKTILDYMSSSNFAPQNSVSSTSILPILYKGTAGVKSRQTNEAGNIEGYFK